MFAGGRKFITEIFQDIDGGYSAKRTAFFILLLLFVAIVLTAYFKLADEKTLAFMQGALDKDTDVLKWLGGFILAERGQAFAPKKPEDKP